MATEILRPNAAGDLCGISGQVGDACPNHYLNVDDITPDEDATCVAQASWPSGSGRDLYNIDDPEFIGGIDTINSVSITGRFRRQGGYAYAIDYEILIKTHDTIYSQHYIDPDTSYFNRTKTWTLNPYTGQPWTEQEVKDLQIGIQLEGYTGVSWGSSGYCTQVYATVNYDPEYGPAVSTNPATEITHGEDITEATVTRQVIEVLDDVLRRLTPPYWNTLWWMAAGAMVGYYQYGCGMRFTNITIPKGANIIEAYLTFRASEDTSGVVVRTRISAEGVDDPPIFADDAAAFDARWANRTTARVDWDGIPAWTTGEDHDSPDIKTVIQEIVDRGGWASGQHIVIFWEDFEDRGDHTGATTALSAVRYAAQSGSMAPKLVITYEAGTATAKLNGVLDDDIGQACDCGFEWGRTTDYGYTTPAQSKGTGEAFSYVLTNLLPDTTYHFRAFATNSAGTSYGVDRTFKTVATPAVTTDAATGLAAVSATLNGTLDSDGGEACECGFEFGLDTGYGTTTPTESKIAGETFSQVIGGLFPNTVYHFRALATNSAGTDHGDDETFTTALVISRAFGLAREEL